MKADRKDYPTWLIQKIDEELGILEEKEEGKT